MKKLENKKINKEKGITLIALVITIIVLLILAGISIATLTGPNGLLNMTEDAREKTKYSQAREKLEVAVLSSYGIDGRLDNESLEKNLGYVEGINKDTIPSPIKDENYPIEVQVDEYKFEVTKDGEVKEKGKSQGDSTECTLTINPNGGAWDGKNESTKITGKSGEKITIENPEAPIGYEIIFNSNEGSTVESQTTSKTFLNWDKDGNGKIEGTSYTFGTGNETITAKYKDEAIILPQTTKDGYLFKGWYTAIDGGERVGNSEEEHVFTESMEIYAQWTLRSSRN